MTDREMKLALAATIDELNVTILRLGRVVAASAAMLQVWREREPEVFEAAYLKHFLGLESCQERHDADTSVVALQGIAKQLRREAENNQD
jgi:hypothetical protein